MNRKHCGCRSKCHCNQQKSRRVVHPVREEVENRHTEERVQHVYPTHTRVVNHHTIRNEYSYPRSTSYENRVNEVDVRGVSDRPGNGVMGEMSNCNRPSHNDVRGESDCNRPKKHCHNHNHHNHCQNRRKRDWW